MTYFFIVGIKHSCVSTHMPLARHDEEFDILKGIGLVSTHMPLARHDCIYS